MAKKLFSAIFVAFFVLNSFWAKTAREEALAKVKTASIAKKNATSTNNKRNKNDPYEMFASAADFLEASRYNEAIIESQKAATLFKNFSAYENGEQHYYDCLTQIGESYLRMGNAKRAQIQFQQTFDLAPQNNDMLLGIAAVYFRLQKYSEGKEFFETAIKKYKGTTASNTKNNSTTKTDRGTLSKNNSSTKAAASANSAKTAAIVVPLYHYYAVCLSGEGNFENALYAVQASQENYLRAGKTIPPEVKKFHDQVVKNLNVQENVKK